MAVPSPGIPSESQSQSTRNPVWYRTKSLVFQGWDTGKPEILKVREELIQGNVLRTLMQVDVGLGAGKN